MPTLIVPNTPNIPTASSRLKDRPIAYFCAEFALNHKIPTYAGGLGILAGDYIREAEDRKIPVVGVGLYYREGYVRKELDPSGQVVELCVPCKPEEVGLTLVTNGEGKPLTVTVPIQDHDVRVHAWKWQIDGIPVYLLDTDMPENQPQDRHITDRLYAADKEIRLKQEMLLGIGGLRFLEALNIHPSLYHLNEGHSAFLSLELIKHEMSEHKLVFEQAKDIAQDHILFTNHTLVPAGNDVFSDDLVSLLFNRYATEINVPVSDIVGLGLVQESSTFSMTILSLRMAGKTNAVSKLHAEKAAEIWKDHPMFPITNGIHVPTWDKINGSDIWEQHKKNKRELLAILPEKARTEWKEDDLILGWARRMVQYKRPLALFENIQRITGLARNAQRPVKIVIAGEAHPSDEEGIQLLKKLQEILSSQLSDIAVYLPNYSFAMAQTLTAGCDVWLNTPIIGFEACGTSGMKACLNGVLPLTTKDGWVSEANISEVGWIADSERLTDSLLDLLEKEIVPQYYGDKSAWVMRMQHARQMILENFTATRMLAEYLTVIEEMANKFLPKTIPTKEGV